MKTKDLEKKFVALDKEIADLKKQDESSKEEQQRLNKLVDELRRDVAELRELVEIKEEETRLLKGVVSQYISNADMTRHIESQDKVNAEITEGNPNSTDLPMSPFPDDLHRKAYKAPNTNKMDSWTFKSGKFKIEGDLHMQPMGDTPKLHSPAGYTRHDQDEAKMCESDVDDKWDVREAVPIHTLTACDSFIIKSSSYEGGVDHNLTLSRASSGILEADVNNSPLGEARNNSYASASDVDDIEISINSPTLRYNNNLISSLSEESMLKFTCNIGAVITVQRFARGFLARRDTRLLRSRTNVVKELVQTEIGYVSSLDALIKFYLKPLRKNSTSPDSFILPSYLDEISIIFSTLEDMRQNNGELLTELVNRLSTWNYFSRIADVFLSRMDLLYAHLPYVVNYERAQGVVKACKQIPEFVTFVNERMKMAELEYKALDDFLILPVQRIPRYIMLLESMHKYLPLRHPDRDNTKNAAAKMRGFANQINKRKEARVKLVEMSGKLIGYPPEEDLLAESRYLVRDGFLFDDKKRARFCILLNDILIVTKSTHSKTVPKLSSDEAKKRKFNFEYSILLGPSTKLLVSLANAPMAGEPPPSSAATPFAITFVNQQMYVFVQRVGAQGTRNFEKNYHNSLITWYFYTNNSHIFRKYVFNTPSDEDGKSWVKDIHSVLEHFRKKTPNIQ